MATTLERYSGIGYDYLILDTKENKNGLNEKTISKILKRSLGMGADGLIVGPITAEGKTEAKLYNHLGEEASMDNMEHNIFERYLMDAGYEEAKDYMDNIDLLINTEIFITGKIKIYD